MSATMEQEVSELSVPVAWGEIRCKVWGPDHGRPVLCLHGWADNCGTFNSLIPLLPKENRYVAMDLAGHGRSSHRPGGAFYTFPSYIADVRRVVDGLQWTKFTILGHSMGGNIGTMFTVMYPEMVEALILLDILGFLPTVTKKISEKMRNGIYEMIQFENKTEEKKKVYTYKEAVKRLLAANPTLSEQSAHILLERSLVQVEGGFVFSRDLRVKFNHILRLTFETCLEMQPRIRASVLIILGDKGLTKTVSDADKQTFISALLQGWHDGNHTVVTVSGSHYVHLNHPELVAPVVCDFLRTKVFSQPPA